MWPNSPLWWWRPMSARRQKDCAAHAPLDRKVDHIAVGVVVPPLCDAACVGVVSIKQGRGCTGSAGGWGTPGLVSTIRASTTVSRSSSTIPGRATPTPSRWERSTWFSSGSAPALRPYCGSTHLSPESQMMEVWLSRLARNRCRPCGWVHRDHDAHAQRTPRRCRWPEAADGK